MKDNRPTLAQILGISGLPLDAHNSSESKTPHFPSRPALDGASRRNFRRLTEDEYSRRPINSRPSIGEGMRKHKHNKAFGKTLREIRKQQGYTQETLAFECGLDRTYISLLELGSSSPTLDTIMALCEALGFSLAQIASRVEAKMARKKP